MNIRGTDAVPTCRIPVCKENGIQGGCRVLALQERNRALHNEASIDALTGLRNRLALDEVLDMPIGADDVP